MYQFKWFRDCCAQGWLLIPGLYSSKISSQIIIVLPHSKEVTNSQTVHIKQKLISLLVLLSAFCSHSFPHSFSIYRTCKSQTQPFSIILPPFGGKPTQIFRPHTMFLLFNLYLSSFCTPRSFSSYNYIKIFDLLILLCLSIICHLVHSFICSTDTCWAPTMWQALVNVLVNVLAHDEKPIFHSFLLVIPTQFLLNPTTLNSSVAPLV